MNASAQLVVAVSGRRRVRVDPGSGNAVELPLAVLRDACPCPDCRHAGGQRLLDPASVPADLRIDALESGLTGFIVTWGPAHHVSTYGWDDAGLVPPSRDSFRGRWDAATDAVPVGAHLDDLSSPSALAAWLEAVERDGVALLHGVPLVDGEVARVAERFAHVRVTNYGRWFDVRSTVDPANLANSSFGLPVHTDNPYRDPVPTLQLLHCLATSVRGGDNVVVDGLAVVEDLAADAPEALELLATVDVRFAYRDATASLEAAAPLVERAADGGFRALRFNSRSMVGPVGPVDVTEAWYDAYLTLARRLGDARYERRFRLEPGDLFVVDNRRVLHGRTGYDPTAGSRHLQGCYADLDGVRSTLARLRQEDHR